MSNKIHAHQRQAANHAARNATRQEKQTAQLMSADKAAKQGHLRGLSSSSSSSKNDRYKRVFEDPTKGIVYSIDTGWSSMAADEMLAAVTKKCDARPSSEFFTSNDRLIKYFGGFSSTEFKRDDWSRGNSGFESCAIKQIQAKVDGYNAGCGIALGVFVAIACGAGIVYVCAEEAAGLYRRAREIELPSLPSFSGFASGDATTV